MQMSNACAVFINSLNDPTEYDYANDYVGPWMEGGRKPNPADYDGLAPHRAEFIRRQIESKTNGLIHTTGAR